MGGIAGDDEDWGWGFERWVLWLVFKGGVGRGAEGVDVGISWFVE